MMEPLTDSDLDRLEHNAQWHGAGMTETLRLIAEVRQLRRELSEARREAAYWANR